MEKEKSQVEANSSDQEVAEEASQDETVKNDKQNTKEKTPEEKITELEEKIVRQYAVMENQRRRYDKEKEDAF